MSESARWQQFDVAFAAPDDAARLLARLGAWLSAALDRGEVTDGFFMQKPPGLRIRLANATVDATRHLAGDGLVITPARYEPETWLFDGPAGLAIAHRHFTADSIAIGAYIGARLAGHASPPPVAVSLAMSSALLRGLGLDRFERWDVWMRTLVHRGGDWRSVVPRLGEPPDASGCESLLADYRRRIAALADRVGDLPLAHAFPNGLRRTLPFWLMFHWNRMGFDAETQRRAAALMASIDHPRAEVEALARAWAS